MRIRKSNETEMKMGVRKKLPLYLQIEAILKSKIFTGELKMGDRLPSEVELARQFGVSPLTVRQALSFLVNEGLLDRTPGRGTIIKKNFDEKITLTLSGKMDELLSLGKETETIVLRSEIIEAQTSNKPLRALKLNPTDRLSFVEKVRYWKENPFMVVEEYVPNSIISNLSPRKKMFKSLLSILIEGRGIFLKEALQTMESSTADQRIASLLQIEMGSPIFYMERTFFEKSGIPVLFQITFTRAEHFKLCVHLGREQKEKEMKWVVY